MANTTINVAASSATFNAAVTAVTGAAPVDSTVAQLHMATTLGTYSVDPVSGFGMGGASKVGYINQGGLFWSPANMAISTYAQADGFCRTSTMLGLKAGSWRLPTITELSGLSPRSFVPGQYATGGLFGNWATVSKSTWTAIYTWSSTPTWQPNQNGGNFPGYWGQFFADLTNQWGAFKAGMVIDSAPNDKGNVTCVTPVF